jgi:hypothetical protein
VIFVALPRQQASSTEASVDSSTKAGSEDDDLRARVVAAEDEARASREELAALQVRVNTLQCQLAERDERIDTLLLETKEQEKKLQLLESAKARGLDETRELADALEMTKQEAEKKENVRPYSLVAIIDYRM